MARHHLVSVSVRSATSAVAVASVCLGSSTLLAFGDIRVSAGLATILVATSLLARVVVARVAPWRARGFVLTRLCSPRYQLRAFALPLASAAAITRSASLGVVLVFAVHLALAWRYRRRWQQPNALKRALPVALVAGFYAGLERLALSGGEWRYGGRLVYAEESHLQRVILVERGGSLDLFLDG